MSPILLYYFCSAVSNVCKITDMKINRPNKIDNINYFKLAQRNVIYKHRHVIISNHTFQTFSLQNSRDWKIVKFYIGM